MKIIISPSKKQNRKCVLDKALAKPYFGSKSSKLRKILKNLDRSKLSKVLNVNGNLLDKTHKKYLAPKGPKAAISYYNGLVFKQLEIKKYTDESLNYMENNLYILSAMYGVLTPLTAMVPYRLDMKVKLKDIDLYEYWQEEIDNFFNDNQLIINLASNEFSKMLQYKNYSGRFITIDFKEYDKNNKLRIVAARAKKARGLMVDKMIKKQIKSIEEIKSIEVLEYIYDSQASFEDHLVFIRE